MPSIEKKALDLIALTYSAALDKQQWPRLIEAVSGAIGSQGGMLRLVDYSSQKVGFFETVGYEAGFTQAYRDYFFAIDPHRHFFENSPVGIVMASSKHLDYNSVSTREFYNDYMRPQNKEYLLGATLARDVNASVQFGIQRSKQAGEYGNEDLQLMRLLLPHLTQAVQVQRLIGETTARADMAFSVLNQVRAGIFIMDTNGKVLHINRAGEKILASGELAVKQKRLALKDSTSTARLCQLIASATQYSFGQKLECGSELRLFSVEGKISLELRVIPLIKQDALDDYSVHAGCAAVFVSCPGELRLPWQKVASSYSLSPAEAKLAVLLAEGCRPEQASERLFVSINTVRSQLKSVFAKTGMRCQSELIAMLLSGMLAWCNTETDEE